MRKRVTVHMIGNAHIDPVWRWRWQEGYAETLATCRAAIDRMEDKWKCRSVFADLAVE